MHRILLLYILFLLLPLRGSSQNKAIDSIKQLIGSLENNKRLNTDQSFINDSLYINCLNELSWEFFYLDVDTAIIIGNKALAFAEKIGLEQKVGDCHQFLGIFYSVAAKYQVALEHNYKALEIWEKLEHEPRFEKVKFIKFNKAQTLGNIGIVNKNLANYPKALEYYFRALKTGEEIKSKGLLKSNYNNIGVIYDMQSDYPKALEYYYKALKIAEDMDNKHVVSGIIMNIAQITFKQGDYPKTLGNYFKALKISEELEDKNALSGIFIGIASTYLELKNLSQAKIYYTKALQLAEETGSKNSLIAAFSGLGSLSMKQNNLPEAQKYFTTALDLSKEAGAKNEISTNYKNLYRVDSISRNFKSAFSNYKNYILYRDSIFNEENTKKSVQAQMQYEFDKKEASAKDEQDKKDALALKEKQKQNLIINSVSAGLFLVLVFLIFIFRSYRQKRKANIAITEQKIIIEQKQKEILDSIYYARRIQRSLLPTEKYIQKSLTRIKKEK
jgi:tetratricopeptide (TPR) repeat protein